MTREQAFHEALEAYGRARVMATNLKCTWPEDAQERREALVSAEARVLALYAERQGEEGQVTRVLLEGRAGPDEVTITLPRADSYAVGDKVRVTKVEEGQ